MPGNSHKKVFLKTILLLVSGILILSLFFASSGFLTPTKRIDSNVLLIEGWLPTDGIAAAYKEYQKRTYDYVITTGLEATFNSGFLYSDGFLIFYPKEKLSSSGDSCRHVIEIVAFSQLGGENSARFNFYLNNSLLADFVTSTQEKKYSLIWEGSLSDIDSITIEFTNDMMGEFGDRNLTIREIIIDKTIVIPTINHSEYDIGKLDHKNRIINNYSSYATKAKYELNSIGIDTNRVIALPGTDTRVNRTLASALEVGHWLDSTRMDITGINIVSYGLHSRRTWMIYKRVMGRSCRIGIISIPDNKKPVIIRDLLQSLRETIGLAYYWIITLPYQFHKSQKLTD